MPSELDPATARPSGPSTLPTPRASRLTVRLPAPVSRAVVLDFGSVVLVCGGLTSSGATTGAILELELGSRTVVRRGGLVGPVHDAGGAVLNGWGYVFGSGRFGPGALVQRVGPTGATATIG
ncbi:MAG: hypothetical protein ACRDGI_04575, partial [Candidatus Limnocylindrales bacterium]